MKKSRTFAPSANTRKPLQDQLLHLPEFIQPSLQIPDILRIDASRFIGAFCVLIQVVAASAKKDGGRYPHGITFSAIQKYVMLWDIFIGITL